MKFRDILLLSHNFKVETEGANLKIIAGGADLKIIATI